MTAKNTNKLKILNDPIYGFITIPNELIFDLIEHPYFQRLRRVSQMGLSYMVYPGAHHTRFLHAIGAMYLMQKAVRVLRFKNVNISRDEEEAVYIAILLHDIGHGAFSHALEHSIVSGISHEEISLKFMESLNVEFNGKLSLAIEIFKGNYHRKFLHQLISSQLDMDRLDYLKRDSFYTGVSEGNINSERLIVMLNVKDEELVVEEKGIYSVEKFIIARRLMYWQVYLHKTGIVAENILVKILKRAKELAFTGIELKTSTALNYFLYKDINSSNFDDETLSIFSQLDDYDILSAIKEWTNNEDKVLSRLSRMLVDRRLMRIEIQNESFSTKKISQIENEVKLRYNLNDEELGYFFIHDTISNQAYNSVKNQIHILYKNGELKETAAASDQLNLQALSTPVVKHFICYPKGEF
ncbi:HD domain-containing protein [Urechidicola vernalis]|uniref:HD domain-containing protein n=1 Tax=Urechidicola vernalis TaxID=3075600 RepID=A0ABU2Y1G9_9FLAO|nr:HD domain-containing protein [Urechidicola sp. P050]MDT0551651.1 HD domain-containing protein [Urechidicola sp. P050]